MPRELFPCGTRAAYTRHLRYRQVPCAPCLEANRRASYAWRHGPPPVEPLMRQLLDLIAGECKRAGLL